jgi:hypothetical protein
VYLQIFHVKRNIELRFYCFVYSYIYMVSLLIFVISVQKTKSMAFRGRDPVRTKIVIDNKIIEQVNKPDEVCLVQPKCVSFWITVIKYFMWTVLLLLPNPTGDDTH